MRPSGAAELPEARAGPASAARSCAARPSSRHCRRSEDVQAARETHGALEPEIAEQEPTADGGPGRGAERVRGIEAAHDGSGLADRAYDAARQSGSESPMSVVGTTSSTKWNAKAAGSEAMCCTSAR